MNATGNSFPRRCLDRAWVLVAATLLYSSFEKLATLLAGGAGWLDLGTIAGDVAARLPGGWWTLAVVKLLLAAMLALGGRVRALGAGAAMVFLSMGVGLFVVEMSRPEPRACGCLGTGSSAAGTRSDAIIDLSLSVARNTGLIACLLPVFRRRVLKLPAVAARPLSPPAMRGIQAEVST